MPTLDLPPPERLAALKQFTESAEDATKAREWLLEILDPTADSDLLDYLAEEIATQPKN